MQRVDFYPSFSGQNCDHEIDVALVAKRVVCVPFNASNAVKRPDCFNTVSTPVDGTSKRLTWQGQQLLQALSCLK